MDAISTSSRPCSNGADAFLALNAVGGSSCSSTVEKSPVEPIVVPSLAAVVNPKKKRNVGRAARRRRRKWNEIQHQATAVPDDDVNGQSPAHGGGGVGAENSCAPRETTSAAAAPTVAVVTAPVVVLSMARSRAVPAVAELRSSNTAHQWTPADEKLLHVQLGYVPGNAIGIVARVSDVTDCWCNLQTTRDGGDCSSSIGSVGCGGPWNDANNPVVVQLYPLVCRSPHAGGKAGGLRFKARKRKWYQQRQQQQQYGNHQVNAETFNVSPHTNNSNVAAVHCDTIDNTAQDQDPSSLPSRDDDAAEEPLVIEPFPTIYWLTHPLLSSWISQLERDGHGTLWERRLAAHPDALASMQRAHAAYGQERLSLLTDSDVQYIRHRQWDSALAVTRGVAGSTNVRAVKCLHAHTAHYLSGSASCTDNVIGQWVLETLGNVHMWNNRNLQSSLLDAATKHEHVAQEDHTDDAIQDK
jgi:hypothetical protein